MAERERTIEEWKVGEIVETLNKIGMNVYTVEEVVRRVPRYEAEICWGIMITKYKGEKS